ncbi:aminotransferase class IV family protein [Embleya sp. NBC_00888]|uniref:aminotransferase class IV family protein n=1 Tax=Embleya sp. NBC_00888 TaxID=2975960 RepID=UPI00386C4B4B|nr:aminotransferase class IV family protein [Embleya sp. NBC_00888]
MEINGAPAHPDDLAALALSNIGHFTSMRVENGRVRGLDLHLARLIRDCRIVFDADLDPDRVRTLVRRFTAGRDKAFVVRVTVFDPAIGLADPTAPATPHILVGTRPAGPLTLPPLRVLPLAYRRDLPEVKHVGLFGQLRQRRRAMLAGYDDALFVEPDGRISEGGTWNIGFVVGDRLIRPDAPCLRGVTADLLQAHRPAPARPVRIDELAPIQAAFATNTAIGVRPISAIGTHVLPTDHPLLATLADTYRAIPGDLV